MPSAPIVEQQASEDTIHQPLAQNIMLSSLSDEILLIIVKYVGCDTSGPMVHSYVNGVAPDGPKNVRNFALCSRRLYQIAFPLMYSHFRRPDTFNAGRKDNLVPFMLKILAQPELAGLVHVFHDRATMFSDSGGALDMPQVDDEDWTRVQSAVHAAGRFELGSEEWFQAIKWGYWDDISALIFSLLPNLEELELEGWASTQYFPTLCRYLSKAAELQEANNASAQTMSKLRSVAVYYWDTEDGLNLEDIIIFLKLKSVQSFYAHMILDEVRWDISDPPLPEWHDSSFSTKSLQLDYSSIDHLTLVRFLSCFTSLESLHYQSGYGVKFEPPRVLEALVPLKHCLQSLTIFCIQTIDDTPYEKYALGSLTDFGRLKSINMDAYILLGVPTSSGGDPEDEFPEHQDLEDCLPYCLESLRLQDCDSHIQIAHKVSKLIQHKDTYTPELKRLDIGWRKIPRSKIVGGGYLFQHPGFEREEALSLMDACQRAGVETVIK